MPNNAIETRSLTKLYSTGKGITNIDLLVPEGCIFGFLGSNGAGKTTTIRVLLGLLRYEQGSISILGKSMPQNYARINSRLGIVPGEIQLYQELTGLQLLDYFQGFMKGKPVMRAELLDAFGLSSNDLAMKVRHYSQGMKQKLLLIQAMQHDPDLLILDEPSERLDPLNQQLLYDYIRAFKKRGKTIFFSSHNLPEVEKLCDHVGIVKDGCLLVQEEVEILKQKIPRCVEIWFSSVYDAHDFSDPRLNIIEEKPDYVKLELTGDVGPLLKMCSKYDIREMFIPPPSMEKLFMSYYYPNVKEME